MQQNYTNTQLPTLATSPSFSEFEPAWSNPMYITADDGNYSTWGAGLGGASGEITASAFIFPKLPDGAVIDGLQVFIDGSQFSAMGSVFLNVPDTTSKDMGALNGGFGGPADKWGANEITVSDLENLTVSVFVQDISGGDAFCQIDYLSVTIFWHIEVPSIPADVPTRIDYKVYSRSGKFLGLLPNVTSKFGFAQDMNSAGSSIEITCGKYINNDVKVTPLLTEDGDPILTESGLPITTTYTDLVVAPGNSPDDAIFKNSNRVVVWMYNRYYPNGKPMFSGQVNRVKFRYGASNKAVKLVVLSDGLDLDQFIARGFPFAYTPDVSQLSENTSSVIQFGGGRGAGFVTYGQTWITGAAVNNIGSISLLIQGTADVTVAVYDAPNGDLIGSVTKPVANGTGIETKFEFAQLLPVTPNTTYFMAVWLNDNQAINIFRSSTSVYANGTAYEAVFTGTAGGSFYPVGFDLWFKTASGTPTTTTTFNSKDPVANMAHDVLLDYNARGGYIKEREFVATGLSLSYTFVVATVFDVIKKVLELSPRGYYSYVDLGTAEIDLKPMSTTADFTVIRGYTFSQLDIDLSIEQVKNYLLLSGGEVSPNVNLFRDYQDTESSGNYGIRSATKSDNRVKLAATADAIGNTFIEENSEEKQETQLVVLNSMMDITLLTPGKTIGFKNFDSFVDNLVLPIVRREPNFSDGYTVLTLGRLPVRLSDEVQRINRELLLEQTVNNPSQPS